MRSISSAAAAAARSSAHAAPACQWLTRCSSDTAAMLGQHAQRALPSIPGSGDASTSAPTGACGRPMGTARKLRMPSRSASSRQSPGRTRSASPAPACGTAMDSASPDAARRMGLQLVCATTGVRSRSFSPAPCAAMSTAASTGACAPASRQKA